MSYQVESFLPHSSINCSYPSTCTIKFMDKGHQQQIVASVKWRLGTSMPIIGTVSYCVEDNQQCCTVEFERIVGEISGLGRLTVGQGVYLIKEYILGAQIVIVKFGGLDELNPRECFYGINSKGQAKIWLSRDYTEMRTCKKIQEKTKVKEQSMNVFNFVAFLFCRIEGKVNGNESQTFKEIAKKMMKGEMRNFADAYQKLKKIIQQYEITIPLSLRKACFRQQSRSKVKGSVQKPRMSLKCQKPSVNPYFLRKMKSINNEGGMFLIESMKERNHSPAASPHFRPFKGNNKSEYQLSNKRPQTNYVNNNDQNSKLGSQRQKKMIDSCLTNSIRKKTSSRLHNNDLVKSLKSLKQQKTGSNHKMSENKIFESYSCKKNGKCLQNVIINEFNPLQEQVEEDQTSFLCQNNKFAQAKAHIQMGNANHSHQIRHQGIFKGTEKGDEKSKQIPKFLTSLLHNKNVQLKVSSEISSSRNQGGQFLLRVDKKSMTTTQASGMEAHFNKDSITKHQSQKQDKILPKISGENLVVFQVEKEILNSIVIETPIDSFRSFEEDQLNNFGKGYDFGGLVQVESKVLETSSSHQSFNHSIEGKSVISMKGSRKSLVQKMEQNEQKFKINFVIMGWS